MTRRAYLLPAMAVALLCAFNNACLMAQDQDVSERLLSTVKATSPREAKRNHSQLFFKAAESDLRLWRSHTHLNIALRAAWEPVRRSIGGQTTNQTRAQPDTRSPLKPSTAAIYRFVGLLEGRLALELPKWWEDSLLKARAHGPNNFYFPMRPQAWPYKRTEEGVFVPREMTLRKEGTGFAVTMGGRDVTIGRPLIDESKGKTAVAMNVLIGRDRCYVAMHSLRCNSYYLSCVSRRSGELLWTARVWASGDLVNYEGTGHHFVSLIVKDDALYVFGGGDDSVYVEAVATKTGKTMFRFSTSY